MNRGAFVSYLRVSTERQGRSGLGLEPQRRADFLAGRSWQHVAELIEIESSLPDPGSPHRHPLIAG